MIDRSTISEGLINIASKFEESKLLLSAETLMGMLEEVQKVVKTSMGVMVLE